jgi:membrane protease YdiL (CAAX protease family)
MVSYLILFYLPFVLIFITAFLLLRAEGCKLSWSSIKSRCRLNKIDRKTWIWTAGLFVFWFVVLLLVQPLVGKIMARIPFFAPPSFFPPELNPNLAPSASGMMFGTELSGKWWIIPAYFAGWFFNIFGEEFLFRGYLLPRQEQTYGKYAWVIHGTMWGLWHFFWKWNVISLLITSLSLSYVAQKTKNTWVGIIVHGSLNFIPLIMIIVNVIG